MEELDLELEEATETTEDPELDLELDTGNMAAAQTQPFDTPPVETAAKVAETTGGYVAGAVELAAEGVTGAAAALAAPWYAAIEAGKEGKLGRFPEAFSEYMQEFTYEPRTESGKASASLIGHVMESYQEGVRGYISDPVFEMATEYNQPASYEEQYKDRGLPVEEELDDSFMVGEFVGEVGKLAMSYIPSEVATSLYTAFNALPFVLTPRLGPKALVNKAHTEVAMNDLVNQGKVILGRDVRTFDQAKETWFFEKPIETIDKKTGRPKRDVILTRRWNDMSERHTASFDPNKILPGKFVAEKNPVAKWAIDYMDKERINTDRLIEDFYYKPTIVTKLNRPTMRPTERGGLTKFESLPTEQQALVAYVADRYNRDLPNASPRIEEVSPELLSSLRFSRKNGKLEADPKGTIKLDKVAVQSYYDLRGMLEKVRLLDKHIGKTHIGKKYKGLEYRPAYFPKIVTGDFRVWVKRKGNPNAISVRSFETKLGANYVMSQMKKKLGDEYDVKLQIKKSTETKDIAAEAFGQAKALLNKQQKYDEAAKLDNLMEKVSTARGFAVHKARRERNVAGYLGDPRYAKSDTDLVKQFEKSIRLYTEGGIRSAINMRVRDNLHKLYADEAVVRNYPNTVGFVKMYQDNFLGKRGWIDEQIYKNTRNLLGETGLEKVLGFMSTTTLYSKLFFHRLTFLVPQAVQPLQTLPAQLVRMQGWGLKGDVGAAIAKSYKSMVKPDNEAKYALQVAAKERVIEPKFIEQFASTEFLKTKKSRRDKAIDVATGKWEAAKTEEYGRMQASLMFFHFLRDSGVNKQQAAADAAYLANKYMVEYHRIEKPLIYTSQATRPMGQFKTFQSNYIAQAIQHVQAASGKLTEGDIAPAMAFMASQVATTGLSGMLGLQTADALMEMMGSDSTLTEMILRNAPDWLAFGPMQATTGTYSGTIEAPQLNIVDLFSFPQLEYYGGMFKATYDLVAKKIEGTATPLDVERLLLEVSPPSFKGMIEQAFETGKITMAPDDDDIIIHDPKTGRGITRRDFSGYMSRLVGGRSVDEIRAMKAMMQLTRLEKKSQLNKQSLAQFLAYSMLNELPVDYSFIGDQLSEWNIPYDSFQKSVWNEAKKMSTTVLERTVNIRTRTGRNAYQVLSEMLPEIDQQLSGKYTEDLDLELETE